MTGFTREWLALRAPFDARARDPELARLFAAALPEAPLIVDLGAGTGGNARFLSPLLGPRARFRLVDNDPHLLDAARTPQVEIRQADLTRDQAVAVAGAEALVAASLMDLVSAAWFDRLAALAAQHRWPLLFALSVDGKHEFTPADDADAVVLAAFARDQGRDKGFGAALGPRAPAYMSERLAALGAQVRLAPSAWRIDAAARDMLAAMVEGIAEAAIRASTGAAAPVAGWRERRRTQIQRGDLSLVVGHQDLLAVWPDQATRRQ